jgi:hypothetical protein
VVFPFVVGSERSGTTLLRLMLDAHPDLAVPPESYFVVELLRKRDKLERDGVADVDAVTEHLAGHRWFAYWDMPPSAVRDAVEATRGGSLPDAIRAVFGGYARMHDKPRAGDKTPAYVMQLPLLARSFPEARFLHLIRDGREVALSLAEVSWGPGNVLDAALQWRERVERGRRGAAKVPQDRYLEARYERLVAEPDAALGEVAAFFDLSFDPAMLEHGDRAPERMPRAGREHERSFSEPRPGLRDWRTEMPRDDLEAVEAAVGDLLEVLGYERAVPSPSKDARGRADAARKRRESKHRRRRWKAGVFFGRKYPEGE